MPLPPHANQRENSVTSFSQPHQKPLTAASWFIIILTSALLCVSSILTVTMWVAPTNIHIPIAGGGNGESVGLRLTPPGEKVILVLGVDVNYQSQDRNTFAGTRTDTMMLVRISPEKNTLSIVSIPRDSKVFLAQNHGIDKINAAHAVGGPELAVETVEDSFGIPIDNYVVVNFQGVHEVIDAMDGVDIYVDKRMKYTDHTAKLYIDFEPGMHHLSGKEAEGFLRFRHDAMADIGRIRRQQAFISSVTSKMKDPWIVTKIPELIRIGTQYIQTDMNMDEMMRLSYFMKDVKMDQVRVATLPGHPSGGRVSYWVIDPQPAQMVLDRLVLDNPGSPLDQQSLEANPLKVGILYAPGLEKEIETLSATLESKAFKVACKSPLPKASTQVIEHTERVSDRFTHHLRNADPKLAKARLIFAPVGTTFENNVCSGSEDYTIILGQEYSGRGPKE